MIRTLTTTLALAVLSAALAGFFVLAALPTLARRVADRVVGHIFAGPRSSAAASHELDTNCGIAAIGARTKRRKVNWGAQINMSVFFPRLHGKVARSCAATSRTLLGLSVWLTLFVLGWVSTAQAVIPASERAVLTALYASTNGAAWINNTNWNGPVGTECTWYGISCASDKVNIIRLGSNGLNGTLPDLKALTILQVFIANDNQLSGAIPDLSGMSKLLTFYVPNNQLSGSIPDLSGMTSLMSFDVSNNHLSGAIPDLNRWGTGGLSFVVADNQLTGPVPAPPSRIGANLCRNNLISSGDPAIDAAWVRAQSRDTFNAPAGVPGGDWLACQNGAALCCLPPWTCTLTATPASIPAGGISTLSASCSPGGVYYWSANAGFGQQIAAGTVSPKATTTYTVRRRYADDAGIAGIATVTVASSPPSLSVTKSGTGSGTITSSAGINCGHLCSATFPGSTNVILSAIPAFGSTFAGWSGACMGTGTCVVTVNGSTELTATFNIVPFVAAISEFVTDTLATITATILFNAPDEGKTGAVYVTAWVPVGALRTLGIAVAADSPLSITNTTAAPNLAGAGNDLHNGQGLRAEPDATAFVLVQLTSTGWQVVSNGQLIPYASGVLGRDPAALTILQDADTSNLAGAQFCLGYGTSATDMIATGNVQLIATIPDSSSASSTNTSTGTCLMTQLPVYRFVDINTGVHFLTISEAEKNDVLQNKPWLRSDGIGFYAHPTPQPGTLPVHRFVNTRDHFFTLYESERNIVIQDYKAYTYEGIAFFAYPTQQPATLLPVYRFQGGGRFLTASETEKASAIQNSYFYDGVGFYAYDRGYLP